MWVSVLPLVAGATCWGPDLFRCHANQFRRYCIDGQRICPGQQGADLNRVAAARPHLPSMPTTASTMVRAGASCSQSSSSIRAKKGLVAAGLQVKFRFAQADNGAEHIF